MFQSNRESFHFERMANNLELMFAMAVEANEKLTKLAQNKEVVIEQAFLNFWVSKSTVPLMQEVIKVAKNEDTPLNKILIEYMEKHIPEELGHEEWCITDLKKLGISRSDVINKIPSSSVASLIGSQYYWINNYHPVSFMGYLACLEVRHPTVEYVNELISRSKLPASAFSSLMHHAKEDIYHKQDIIDLINSLPLNAEQYRIMELSAFQTARWAALCMEEICEVVKNSK